MGVITSFFGMIVFIVLWKIYLNGLWFSHRRFAFLLFSGHGVCITCLVEVVVLPFSEIMLPFLNKVDEFVVGSVLGVVFYFNFINIDIGFSWILSLCYVALLSINISTIFFWPITTFVFYWGQYTHFYDLKVYGNIRQWESAICMGLTNKPLMLTFRLTLDLG